ncbi:hypothetical protein IE00_17360 [Paracoccus sp. SM22M-07]|nr:hypothetical protein IE00_17360 [Paracoccus sp. SM22M-07]
MAFLRFGSSFPTGLLDPLSLVLFARGELIGFTCCPSLGLSPFPFPLSPFPFPLSSLPSLAALALRVWEAVNMSHCAAMIAARATERGHALD